MSFLYRELASRAPCCVDHWDFTGRVYEHCGRHPSHRPTAAHPRCCLLGFVWRQDTMGWARWWWWWPSWSEIDGQGREHALRCVQRHLRLNSRRSGGRVALRGCCDGYTHPHGSPCRVLPDLWFRCCRRTRPYA